MNGMTVFGVVTVALGISRAMPQLIRLLRARRAYGVSVDTAVTSMLVSFGWAAYGFLTEQPAISFASGASGIIFALIAASALRFGRQLRELKIAPVWLAVLILMGGFGGAIGLSIVLPISVLAANVPQLRLAYKEGDLTDLSLGTWLLALTEGLIWGGYGIVQRDLAVLVNNSLLVATSALIVAAKLTRAAKPSQPDEAA